MKHTPASLFELSVKKYDNLSIFILLFLALSDTSLTSSDDVIEHIITNLDPNTFFNCTSIGIDLIKGDVHTLQLLISIEKASSSLHVDYKLGDIGYSSFTNYQPIREGTPTIIQTSKCTFIQTMNTMSDGTHFTLRWKHNNEQVQFTYRTIPLDICAYTSDEIIQFLICVSLLHCIRSGTIISHPNRLVIPTHQMESYIDIEPIDCIYIQPNLGIMLRLAGKIDDSLKRNIFITTLTQMSTIPYMYVYMFQQVEAAVIKRLQSLSLFSHIHPLLQLTHFEDLMKQNYNYVTPYHPSFNTGTYPIAAHSLTPFISDWLA